MATTNLPPAPIRDPWGSYSWEEWFRALRNRATESLVSVSWSGIDFTGSNLTSLVTRRHNDLTNMQGGTSAEYYHLTNTQHTNLVNRRFGDVAGGNYSEFESDGTLVFKGTATTWQDIDFPIIIRTTGSNIPTLTTLQGNVTAPRWNVNDFSVCEGQELVHQWKEGSEIQWHVHMVTNGLDATERFVKWEIEWFWASPNGVISSTITDTAEVSIPANTPNKTMIIRQIALSTIGATIGGHIWARLRRIASTGAAPTNSPWCSMLQIHIECDTVGSRDRTTK